LLLKETIFENNFKSALKLFVKIFLINTKPIIVIDNKSNKDNANEMKLNLNISNTLTLDNLIVFEKNFKFILAIITLKI